jgi:hypothetical protein
MHKSRAPIVATLFMGHALTSLNQLLVLLLLMLCFSSATIPSGTLA